MKIIRLLFLFVFSLVFYACQQNEIEATKTINLQPHNAESAKRNPYYLENMRNALVIMGEQKKADNLEASHFYVKFYLKTSDEVDFLVKKNIDLSSTPLDVLNGNNLPKPEVKKGKNEAEFFGILPKNMEVGAIRYEILYPIFIPGSSELEMEQKAFELLGYNIKKEQMPQSGNVSFYDPISHEKKPLEGVKVVLREFAKKQEVFTNQNGQFVFEKRIITPNPSFSLVFDNAYTEIRHFTVDNIFELFLPINHQLGSINIQSGNDISIEINPNENTNALLQTAAATLSALNIHRKFSEVNGYFRPQKKMNIWLAKDAILSTSYAAPMLRNIAVAKLGNIKLLLQNLFGLPAPIANSLAHIVKSDLPDIYAPYYLSYNLGVTPGFMEALLHEFSHSVHFAKVGTDFWTTYIQHIYANGGYGDGNQPQSGLVAMSEAWAEDLSLQCAQWYYGEILYTDVFLDINTTPAYSWIPWGIYYDLFDDSNSENWDEVSNIGFNQMYSIFNSEINTPQKFKEALKANFDQVPGIEQKIETIFNHYGF